MKVVKSFVVCLLCFGALASAAMLYDDNFNVDAIGITTTLYNTYYGGGACGLNPSNSETDLVAMPWPNSNFDFAFCGACYQFTGPNNGSSTVKVFDWGSGSSASIYDQQWVLNGYPGNSPYNNIGCTGGSCDVTIQLVPCPVTGGIVLEFNQYNNAYYILVNLVNIYTPVMACNHSDATTPAGTANVMTHDQASYVWGNYLVILPFNLTCQTIVGEILQFQVTGLPGVSGGGWPSGDLGSTASVTTNVQSRVDFSGISGTGNTGSSSSSPASYRSNGAKKLFEAVRTTITL